MYTDTLNCMIKWRKGKNLHLKTISLVEINAFKKVCYLRRSCTRLNILPIVDDVSVQHSPTYLSEFFF